MLLKPEAEQGPRYEGSYILRERDVLECNKFNDGIARGSWPIEKWPPGKNVELTFFKENDYYEIPSRCLESKTISNLFFAGKNISASESAIASARVMGTCLQTGYAAGVLAAGYCENIPVHNSITEIRDTLFNQ